MIRAGYENLKIFFARPNQTYFDNHQTELQKQIKEAEEINNLSTNSAIPPTSLALSYETHSEAIYTSRLLNFNNLLIIITNDMII